MSYDISIKDDKFNITWNISPMFYKHNENGIRFIYGKTGAEANELLLDMYNYFFDNKEDLKKLNPENGWGSWSYTVKTLHKMIMASDANPDDIWEGD